MNRSIGLAVMSVLWSIAVHAAEPAPAEAPAKADEKSEDLSATAQPGVRTSPTAQQPPVGTGQPPAGTGTAKAGADRLQLDTTIISGNRELPKVLYIVPWKKADIGELPSQPFNSLLDEVLAPVDRDVFRREVTYYGVITQTAAPTDGSAAKQQ